MRNDPWSLHLSPATIRGHSTSSLVSNIFGYLVFLQFWVPLSLTIERRHLVHRTVPPYSILWQKTCPVSLEPHPLFCWHYNTTAPVESPFAVPPNMYTCFCWKDRFSQTAIDISFLLLYTDNVVSHFRQPRKWLILTVIFFVSFLIFRHYKASRFFAHKRFCGGTFV